MKILVADDESMVRKVVAARLRADGYDVVEAADGGEALLVAQREELDLLVLDKKMPGLDGFEVLQVLRRDPRTCAVPVVMLTGLDDEETVLTGLDLGVAAFMTKPFMPHELSARVRRALADAAQPPSAAPAPATPGQENG